MTVIQNARYFPITKGTYMKTMITKNKSWTLVALLGLISLTHSYTYTNDVNKEFDLFLQDSTQLVTGALNDLKIFFSTDTQVSYTAILQDLDKKIKNFDNKIFQYKKTVTTRGQNNALLDETLKFADYVLEQIKNIHEVLKRYHDKKVNQANSLAMSLLAVFDKDSTIKAIADRLSLLFNQAKAENNVTAGKAIKELQMILAVEKKTWDAHNAWTLLQGICIRMKHQR